VGSWKIVLGAAGTSLSLVALATGPFAALGVAAPGGSANAQALCIAHHPQDFVRYTRSRTGPDEPELDPQSTHPGSGQDLTWTIVLCSTVLH
jgi:hypothetical protein